MRFSKEIVEKFVVWTKYKVRHHYRKDILELYFHEGQIWWVALGQNIGYEVNGKHEQFHRPVLIIKKYNKDICFVLPLTTQIKEPKPWYQVVITDRAKKQRAVNISQGRTLSSKRLLHKEGSLEAKQYKEVCKIFAKQFE